MQDLLQRLPTAKRHELEQVLLEREHAQQRDPVLFFRPNPCRNCGECYENPACADHRIGQHRFLSAHTAITAAFAGNQFGKTTALVVKAYCQHLPPEVLPAHLRPYRFIEHSEPAVGWIVCPSAKAAANYVIPALQQWAPRSFLQGGSFGRAWAKQESYLRFSDGGRLHLFTYEMDPDKFVGAQIDYVGYDEPPPQAIFNECSVRVIKRGGRQFFTLTPVNSGAGIGWIYRDIHLKREHPDITVVQGSIHDNPHLPKPEVERFLALHAADPDLAARESGEFVHVGGMIYPNGFEDVLVDFDLSEETKKHVASLHVIVSIDPGLKEAAITWHGFDSDNAQLVFDEIRLKDKTPADYALAIKRRNADWGLKRPLYVVDPSFRIRALANKENVQSELIRHGIPAIAGQNAVEAGVQQIRRRMKAGTYKVARRLRALREEALFYRMEDRPDGEFHEIHENCHGLDTCRYAAMQRPFYAWTEKPNSSLGWDPKEQTVGPWRAAGIREAGPLGSHA
jgi:phage terminase large subunit-like protein